MQALSRSTQISTQYARRFGEVGSAEIDATGHMACGYSAQISRQDIGGVGTQVWPAGTLMKSMMLWELGFLARMEADNADIRTSVLQVLEAGRADISTGSAQT